MTTAKRAPAVRGGLRVAGVVLAVAVLLLASACSRRQFPARVAAPTTPAGTVDPNATRAPATDTRESPPKTAVPASETTEPAGAREPEATGLPNVGSLYQPTPPPEVYVVQAGDSLSAIAARFGIDLDALIRANAIQDPNALRVGQTLRLPATQIETGPAVLLLPDSEFVFGPSYVGFDLEGFVASKGGYLADYSEGLGGRTLSGAEVVRRVAHHYSVGPRVLLALLEYRSGWVTNPTPTAEAIGSPLGTAAGGGPLSQQLAYAADRLNRGYYDWRGRGVTFITWGDGTATGYAPSLNAATAALHTYLATKSARSRWEAAVGDGPESFLAAYRRLFGDPARLAIEPLVGADVESPELTLPWSPGELWFYTGGPHGGWGDGSAWSALDFVPDEGYLGCQTASAWVTAAASGLVVYSQDGEVLVDLDGDGEETTGWVLFHLHIAADGRVPVDTRVRQGDRIGHPSCEGGQSEATHVHLARRYNGEWIAADGPLPFVLSGWRARSAGRAYDGTLVQGTQERTACECRQADVNGLRY